MQNKNKNTNYNRKIGQNQMKKRDKNAIYE